MKALRSSPRSRFILILASALLCPTFPLLAAPPGSEGPEVEVPVSSAPPRFFPVDDIFRPLLADPKERQFFMSMSGFRSDSLRGTLWATGFGESLGLARWSMAGVESQFGFLAGVFSQFNWSSESHDLINTDFTIGLATTHRWRALTSRFQLYHQSSHLGDEFLLGTNIPRINFSYEALEGLVSLGNSPFRIYGGGARIVNIDPAEVAKGSWRAGAEFRGRESRAFFRPVAGADVQWKDMQRWYRNISFKAGLEMGRPAPRGRRLRLLGEYYHGFSPFGQFYRDRTQYAGAGIYLGF